MSNSNHFIYTGHKSCSGHISSNVNSTGWECTWNHWGPRFRFSFFPESKRQKRLPGMNRNLDNNLQAKQSLGHRWPWVIITLHSEKIKKTERKSVEIFVLFNMKSITKSLMPLLTNLPNSQWKADSFYQIELDKTNQLIPKLKPVAGKTKLRWNGSKPELSWMRSLLVLSRSHQLQQPQLLPVESSIDCQYSPQNVDVGHK